MKNWKTTGFIATIIIVLAIPLYILIQSFGDTKAAKDEATFVGKDGCIDCHKTEFNLWKGSDHELAMAVATDSSVLGDFNNSEFEYNGNTHRFYKKGGKFFVYTEGPGGKMDEFEITHTFGYTPLQQYLIPFENGKYQCLPISWDTENKKWFHLVPMVYHDEKILPNDWLYWTNAAQNWNGMCAECHSTNLKKNFDPKTKSFNTTYSEINVSCEACHGPGSKHEDWANLPEMARPTDNNYGLVVKSSNINNIEYVELCARCHARRSQLGNYDHESKDLLDAIVPTLINENYHPDGQILEEDYVYGSFIQSKMYDNEVQCNDCHDVHSGKLLFDGNALCAQCHREDIYDIYEHHFHKKEGEKGEPLIIDGKTIAVGEGAKCIECHMPAQYYMGIDLRSDHSLRIPRPDLSISLNTPNACNQCHTDKSAEWSNDYITKWYGITRRPHYGTIIAGARENDPSAHSGLIQIINDDLFPVIIRATALSLLGSFQSNKNIEIIKLSLDDPEPLIRLTAIRSYETNNQDEFVKDLTPLLHDPVRAVRSGAAVRLSIIPIAQLPKKYHDVFKSALLGYKKSNEYMADFPAGRLNLGIMYSNLGETNKAIKNYKDAIEIDSMFYPAMVNLAMMYNRTGDNESAENLFADIIQKFPELTDTYYSLGLLLAEDKKYDEAIIYLKQAADLMPDRARIHYNLALLLQYQQNQSDAEKEFLAALKLEPNNIDFLYALADHYLKNQNFNKAKQIGEQLKNIYPDNPVGDNILKYISEND